jgi:hypothetical protein
MAIAPIRVTASRRHRGRHCSKSSSLWKSKECAFANFPEKKAGTLGSGTHSGKDEGLSMAKTEAGWAVRVCRMDGRESPAPYQVHCSARRQECKGRGAGSMIARSDAGLRCSVCDGMKWRDGDGQAHYSPNKNAASLENRGSGTLWGSSAQFPERSLTG